MIQLFHGYFLVCTADWNGIFIWAPPEVVVSPRRVGQSPFSAHIFFLRKWPFVVVSWYLKPLYGQFWDLQKVSLSIPKYDKQFVHCFNTGYFSLRVTQILKKHFVMFWIRNNLDSVCFSHVFLDDNIQNKGHLHPWLMVRL